MTSPRRYECLANYSTDINGTWTKYCQDLHIHMDIGLFGYYPLIDRGNNTYMQVGFAAFSLPTPSICSLPVSHTCSFRADRAGENRMSAVRQPRLRWRPRTAHDDEAHIRRHHQGKRLRHTRVGPRLVRHVGGSSGRAREAHFTWVC